MFGIAGNKHTRALKKLLGDFELPSFPGVVLRVLERIRDENACAASIAESLALDPGLSVRVLATVNSAAYAPQQRIENLTQAVAMLGISNVESLVLAVAARAALPSPTCRGFDARRFWLAAARRAAAGRALAQRLHPATRCESFTASLLQDMAVPLLAAGRPADYGPVLESWHAGDGSLITLERQVLGCDHAEVGKWLCAEWSLPDALRLAVAGHHGGADAQGACPPAVRLVAHLRETDDDDAVDRLTAAAEEAHGLPADEVRELVRQSRAAAGELAGLLA